MAHLFIAGLGSGGFAVLDLVAREPEVDLLTLVDPDLYQSHNVHRHFFPASEVGRAKTDLAVEWVRRFRPGLRVEVFPCRIEDIGCAVALGEAVGACDVGICAVDSEVGKYHFDSLFRRAAKPWVMGEVLSGGIAGWVHAFEPGGACFGCVCRALQRDPTPADAVDYSQPYGTFPETSVPASRASISAIASIHALVALERMRGRAAEFTSLLLSLARVPGAFERAFEPTRWQMTRIDDCLICRELTAIPADRVDADLEAALDRLGERSV